MELSTSTDLHNKHEQIDWNGTDIKIQKTDEDSNSSIEITFDRGSQRKRTRHLSSSSSSSSPIPLTQKEEQQCKRKRTIQMEHERHHRQQMNNLQMSAGLLRATTCKALNSRCKVKIERLTQEQLSEIPKKPVSQLPKIPRKNHSPSPTIKNHQKQAKVQLISYHQSIFVM